MTTNDETGELRIVVEGAALTEAQALIAAYEDWEYIEADDFKKVFNALVALASEATESARLAQVRLERLLQVQPHSPFRSVPEEGE